MSWDDHKRETWSQWLLRGAEWVASRSKDPSTKVGAIIVRPDKTIASVGYNGFARGVKDDRKLLNDRAEKYERIIHAEMNAILTAREPLQGYTMATWPVPPCARCAAMIIQSGIKKVYSPVPQPDHLERWGDSFKRMKHQFEEAGVSLYYCKKGG